MKGISLHKLLSMIIDDEVRVLLVNNETFYTIAKASLVEILDFLDGVTDNENLKILREHSFNVCAIDWNNKLLTLYVE